jgi:hypothetical protein
MRIIDLKKFAAILLGMGQGEMCRRDRAREGNQKLECG